MFLYSFIKRLFDVSMSLFLLSLLFPIFIFTACFVRMFLGKNIIFSQKRPGKNEKVFTIYKFRTMKITKGKSCNLMPDEKRLTKFGEFLRSTSLDELPQLFNVLKGDMSFVGPRALLVEYLPRYTKEQKRRHLVKPGITGWAQVNGRNAISWEKKFEYDLWYVDNQSLRFDLKIIAMTAIKVFKRTGVQPQGHAIMPRFRGTLASIQKTKETK